MERSAGEYPAISSVLREFLQMFLQINVDCISRFAGKCGEDEAHRAYTQLQSWSRTREARIVICHAGQLLHPARAIPPYQIRGADPFIVYHAIIVLWTFGMMMHDRARKTGTTTPTAPAVHNKPLVNEATATNEPVIVLDAARVTNQSDVNAFILMDVGRSYLEMYPMTQRHPSQSLADGTQQQTIRQNFCEIRFPSKIMKVGIQLLEVTHPDVERQNGPPLIRGLCRLMEELGS